MTHPQRLADLAPTDRLGQTLANMLSQSSLDLPHDINERLRIARQQALAARKPESALSQHVLQNGSSLALAGPPNEGLGWWSVLGSSLPLLALLVGLVLMQGGDREHIVSELAEIDSALLTDDLPPAAYSDPGFIQYLRQNAQPADEE